MSSTNRTTKVYNPHAKKKDVQGSRKAPGVICSSICDPYGGSTVVNPCKKRVTTVFNQHDCESLSQALTGGKKNIVPGASANKDEFASKYSTSYGNFGDRKG